MSELLFMKTLSSKAVFALLKNNTKELLEKAMKTYHEIAIFVVLKRLQPNVSQKKNAENNASEFFLTLQSLQKFVHVVSQKCDFIVYR